MNEMDLKDETAQRYVDQLSGERKAYASRYKSFLQGDDPVPESTAYGITFDEMATIQRHLALILS